MKTEQKEIRGFDERDAPDYDKIRACIHCGLCLPTCPTYAVIGTEMDSPRGRVYLVRSVSEGRIPLSEEVVEHLGLCLDCRACQTACPSGVAYGAILESARAQIYRYAKRPAAYKALERFVLDDVFPHPDRLCLLADLIRIYQISGLRALLRLSHVLKLFPGRLDQVELMLPRVPSRKARRQIPEITPAEGETRRRVAFFSGCVMSLLYPDVNAKAVKLMALQGSEVVTPKDQICCGALHAHRGNLDTAREMAKKNLDAFGKLDVEAIVTDAAGCSSVLKEYPELLKDEPAYREKAEAFRDKIKDISEFLVGPTLDGRLGEVPLKVVYDQPCHLLHAQKISAEPHELIRSIPGVELLPLVESEMCCGSAGIYTLTHTETSLEILDRKMDNILNSGAQAIVTGNPGCLLQLGLGVIRKKAPLEVIHYVELLDRSYKAGSRQATR